MPSLNLPPIESLDVEDLLSLPEGYRYELHEGNLVIMTPSTFGHKSIARRLFLMLHTAGLDVFQDAGVLGDRPRDCRLPDVGVVTGALPGGKQGYSNLPGSAYRLVVEVVSENSLNGEYTDKMDWYAKRGIPEYWIVDQTPDRDEDDAHVRILRLPPGKSTYAWERSLLLSELEAEYRAG
ncbi:Uma2 family endonuclease [Actinoplanes sp. KI2]|uniref:Uma2 family endonuclease n=1 Tax=Actinoplanes sp. KI2 TaxID=2983315 RepID=UPI0021D56BAC|nr:Uma2 family endonuclease [Actinoplanes sp. KI2]MCU7724789.1 Uma2 family endonuclease [Actinoplanes sp. KI2]